MNTHTNFKEYESKAKYVYQFPVRLWHWSMAVSIGVLIVTGYIIGKPWHSITGDPTYLFYMGYTRMAHFIAGYVVGLGLLGRTLYAFFGNGFSRQIYVIPFWRKEWRQNLWHDIRWYLFIDRTPVVHMGHNPLAQLGMFAFIIFLFAVCATGFAMYQEEAPAWYLSPFRFVVDLAYLTGGNSIDLHNWHRLAMKLIVGFLIVHIYMVIREEIMGKTTLLSTMVNGFRQIHPGERG